MFSSYGVWSRLIGSMDNFYQGWTRAVIILIILIPFALVRKKIIKIEKEDIKWLIVFLVFTSMTQAPLFYAFNHMDIGSTSLLFFVSMYLTMNFIGLFFLKEKLTGIKIISSLMAITGMYLIFPFSVSSLTLLAALMAIISGITSGGEVAFSKKLSSKYSSLYLIILSWVIILITNFIISISIGENQIMPSFSITWLWQICYSIAAMLGFWLVIAGVKHIDAGLGALIGLMEIIFAIIFGIIIFNESLTFTVTIGGILIILAVALPNLFNPSTKSPSPQ